MTRKQEVGRLGAAVSQCPVWRPSAQNRQRATDRHTQSLLTTFARPARTNGHEDLVWTEPGSGNHFFLRISWRGHPATSSVLHIGASASCRAPLDLTHIARADFGKDLIETEIMSRTKLH